MRLPDFIIGGAPRSGTTWLYHLLERHPDVYMAKPVTPEPKFFLVDHVYAKGLPYYAQTWFSDIGDTRLAGEKSTDYLESAPAAERIARDLPAVRLIFILREPVERAYSNYLWTRMNGLETESFERALELEEERERTLPERWRFARPYAYFSRGLYADLLQPYIDRIERSRLLMLRFEDIVEQPRELAARVQRFLGISERRGDSDALGVINPSEKDSAGLDDETRRAVAARYVDANRRLSDLLGPDFRVWS